MSVLAYNPKRGKVCPHVLTAAAIVDGVTVAPATEALKCARCGIWTTPLVPRQPHRTADDQITVPGLRGPICVRCARDRGLLEPA